MSNGSARNRVVLVVLDGWGYRVEREGNAIELASTPVWHRLWDSLPADAAGRQRTRRSGCPKDRWGTARWATSTWAPAGWFPRTSCGSPRASRAASSTSSRPWWSSARTCGRPGGTLHLVGLLGPGGVHALDRHLLACVELGVRHRVPAIAIHGFLDGRDSAPTLGAEVVRTLLARHAADRGRAGRHRLADRALLRDGPRPAVGPHAARLRRHGARRRARRWSIRSWRCRPPTSAARPTSSSGRWCIIGTARRWPRCAMATASSSSTTAATGCARSSRRSRWTTSTGSTSARARRSRASP